MRSSFRLVGIVLCVLVACACFAQGRRGGQRGPNFSLTRLIYRNDVQTDLALTADEKTKLDGMRESFRNQRPAPGSTPPTPEEMATRQADQEKQIDGVLTSDQSKRLREIQIQLEGISAITHKNVQASLGLSDAQISQIKDIEKAYRDANTSVREKDQGDNAAMQADMQKNRETLTTDLTKVLTGDQPSKLKDLGGKPFTAEPAQAGR